MRRAISNLVKQGAKNPKSSIPKRKKKVGQTAPEWIFEIDLENMEPWTPTTDIWESEEENFEDPDLYTFGEETTSSSESEHETDWEDDDEDSNGIKRAISGSYLHRHHGDESGDDQPQPGSFYSYRIPELDLIASNPKPEQIASPAARLIAKKLLMAERMREEEEYRIPRGSYLRCEQGGDHLVDTFSRRTRCGPFLHCPVPHSHGALFEPYRWKTGSKVSVGLFEEPTFRRPPYRRVQNRFPRYGRKRTEPIALNCKACSKYAFTHHKDPDMHYQDYVNQVQYQGLNPEDNRKPFRSIIRELAEEQRKQKPKKLKKPKGKKPAATDLSPPHRRRMLPGISKLANDTVATLSKKKKL